MARVARKKGDISEVFQMDRPGTFLTNLEALVTVTKNGSPRLEKP